MRAGCSRVTHPCAGRRQKYCYPRAAPRLACVRPAASVHPEPGSNSSLYIVNELPIPSGDSLPPHFLPPGASQVPLFPNGIAKVLLFPEPPNFSALFFIFFRRIRTAGDFPAALTRAQWTGRQRNPGPDGQIRPGGIFFAGRSGHDGGEGAAGEWRSGRGDGAAGVTAAQDCPPRTVCSVFRGWREK